jgi:hypothetical protein
MKVEVRECSVEEKPFLKLMMKVEVRECSVEEKPFPKLMYHKITGMIVLFRSPSCGTVIANAPHYRKIGDHGDNWNMSVYMDFNGEITIKS